MQRFMSEQERQLVADHYLQLDEGEQLAQLQKTYPNLKEGDFALTASTVRRIEGVFSRASLCAGAVFGRHDAAKRCTGFEQHSAKHFGYCHAGTGIGSLRPAAGAAGGRKQSHRRA